MDIHKERKRTKKWIAAYLLFGFIFLIIGLFSHLFLILTAVFCFFAFLLFKDMKKPDKIDIAPKVQEIVKDNLETKQINMEVNNMQISMEEKAEMLETLSRDEDVMLFLKVTKGQVKYGLLEKLRIEIETKPQKKVDIEPPKNPKAKPESQDPSDSEDEDELIVED